MNLLFSKGARKKRRSLDINATFLGKRELKFFIEIFFQKLNAFLIIIKKLIFTILLALFVYNVNKSVIDFHNF